MAEVKVIVQMRDGILEQPESQAVLHRFSRSLFVQADRIGRDIRAAAQAIESQSAPEAKKVAFDLATQYRELRLLGLLLRTPLEKRREALLLEGELTKEESDVTLGPVEALEKAPKLVAALSEVMPTWFPAENRKPGKVRIYISCSPQDAGLREELELHLSVLHEQQLIVILNRNDDTVALFEERQALEAADMILLLVSANYLASDHLGTEAKRAMERASQGTARVIPIILRRSLWQKSPFGMLQALPADGQPVTAWLDRDSAWTEVVHGIRAIAKSIRGVSEDDEQALANLGTSNISPIQVFVSHGSGNREAVEELLILMAPLEQQGLIRLWHEGMVLPGESLNEAVQLHLKDVRLILVLVTPRLLASRWAEEEMRLLLEQRQQHNDTVLLIPVLLEPTEWQTSPLRKLQALPRNGVAISAWERPGMAWQEFLKDIRQAVDFLRSPPVEEAPVYEHRWKPAPTRVFYSYAQRDQGLKQELDQHLLTWRRQGVISTWGRDQIVPGTEWRPEIDHRLARAEVIVILISSDYLASADLLEYELPRALAQRDAGHAEVLPVLVRAIDVSGTPLEGLQLWPNTTKPVSSWESRDDAWQEVAKMIVQRSLRP